MTFKRAAGVGTEQSSGLGIKIGDALAWRAPAPGQYLATIKAVNIGTIFGTRDALHFQVELEGEDGTGRVRWNVERESSECAAFVAAALANAAFEEDAELKREDLIDRQLIVTLSFSSFNGRDVAMLSEFQPYE